MISLTCTNCKTVLTMDEAFAGGVCRCQHCGTIQTVPSHLKHGASGQSSGMVSQAMGGGAKTLYKNRARADAQPGSGLDAIAEVVASSGLSGSGLSHNVTRKPPPGQKGAKGAQGGREPAKPGKNLVPILVVAGVVILGLIGVVIWLATRGDSSTPPAQASGTETQAPALTPTVRNTSQPPQAVPAPAVQQVIAPKPGKPSYLGIDLERETSVVYLIDRGIATGTNGRFDYLKLACYRSIESLGAGRKFQVIFWNNTGGGGADTAYPATPGPATKANADACRKALDDTYAGGQSSVTSALNKALSESPSAVVLATGKLLDDDFAKSVLDLCKGKPVRVHGVSVGGSDTAAVLGNIARQTGGQARDVNDGELHEAGQ